MSSTFGRRGLVGIVGIALGAIALGGCGSSSKKYDMAVAENEELRQRVVALQAAKETSDDRLEQLMRENEELAGALDSSSSRPSSASGSDSYGDLPAGVTIGSRGGDVVLTVAGDVLFDSGKATLKETAKRDVARIARILQQRHPTSVIRVEGYTDGDPIRKSGWKSNEHLSAERALAVEEELVRSGVDNARIYSAAFGPANQRGSKQESRRVEIVVLAPGG
ncbi:MAG: OmpA family protein [Phycisphaeraceae bacterium]|nr:OmpA family protein [Phycisphaeraceae bacterium]